MTDDLWAGLDERLNDRRLVVLESSERPSAVDGLVDLLRPLVASVIAERDRLAARVAELEAQAGQLPPPSGEIPDQPDRCGRCRCTDCGGRLDEHTPDGCRCTSCQLGPPCSLSEFLPDTRIDLLARALGPLLAADVSEALQQRCLAVAHAAHHAMHDYDHTEEQP